MHKQQYEELVSRNGIFISDDVQVKIKNTKLTFAGCGLGSNIAILAAQVGFTKFVLVDGDKVHYSNINRQQFQIDDQNINKAVALANRLKNINNKLEVEVIDKFIDDQDVNDLVMKSDYIVNTIDYSNTFIALTDIAIKNKKTVFVPFNIGFGSLVMAFNSYSIKLSDLLGHYSSGENLDLYKLLLEKLNLKLPEYVTSKLELIFSFAEKNKYSPQLGIASLIGSALIVTSIIKQLSGEEIKVAPNVIYNDFWTLV